MPLLPADFIQPSLQINLRIILDGTIEAQRSGFDLGRRSDGMNER